MAKKKELQKRPALEQAQNPQDGGMLGNAAAGLVTTLLESGIDGRGPFDSAEEVAAQALASEGTPERAIKKVVATHTRLAAIEGFVTGLGGFVTLPVALPANVVGFYLLATREVAAIAKLRGYDITDPQIRSAVLLTLVGADADDLLRKAGVAGAAGTTGKMTSLAAQGLPGPALMMVNKAVGFRLLTQFGKRSLTRLGRGIPIAGGVLGAGLDGFLIRSVANQARQEFPQR
ncbi:MAG: EcsC family protein [Actinomycetales bacterium]|nr:EcsC family protein [Actinomycetales bacterium]